jgi:hypothetical protein
MLRPATPLAVLFLVAFVLLLLSTLSTPIIKAIPLASWKGATFGVWGFCEGSKCSNISIGYSYRKTTLRFSIPPRMRCRTIIFEGLHTDCPFNRGAHTGRQLVRLLTSDHDKTLPLFDSHRPSGRCIPLPHMLRIVHRCALPFPVA